MSDINHTTPVRKQVYEFLKEFKRTHDGCSPTYAEICNHFGWSSETVAYFHVQGLVCDNLVRLDDHSRIVLNGGRYKAPTTPVTPQIIHNAPHRKRATRVRTDENVRTLYASQNGLCWWCDEPLLGLYEVDHRVPVAKDGPDDLANLCLSCPGCNRKKGAKLPHEFNGRLL